MDSLRRARARLPKAPISAKTHGDPRTWTAEQWAIFSEWASSLKDYPPQRERKRKRGKAE